MNEGVLSEVTLPEELYANVFHNQIRLVLVPLLPVRLSRVCLVRRSRSHFNRSTAFASQSHILRKVHRLSFTWSTDLACCAPRQLVPVGENYFCL